MKATKGPWKWTRVGEDWDLRGAGDRFVLGTRRGLLCVQSPLFGGGCAERFKPEHPDARLIAAAPALLKFAKLVLASIADDNDALERELGQLPAWALEEKVRPFFEAIAATVSELEDGEGVNR